MSEEFVASAIPDDPPKTYNIGAKLRERWGTKKVEEVPPKIVAALKASANVGVAALEVEVKSAPEAEPSVEAEPSALALPAWSFCSTRNLDEPLQLDPSVPFDNAAKLISTRAWHRRDEIRTLHHWQRSFWDWDGLCYREREADEVRAYMWKLLAAAETYGKGGRVYRFEPDPAKVSATIDALKSVTHLGADIAMPGWFGEGRPSGDLREVIACTNGLLHVPTRSLLPHSPRFWSGNCLDFRYDPLARAPRFEKFLEEIFPKDDAAQQTLLEMLGYCTTDLTKYQRGFMFVGPPRGGRGTIGRVLRGLIGKDNYIGTSLAAFSEQFGMESFIAKKVAVFSDARLDGVPRKNLTKIAERMLSITGEDGMHVNRKNTKYWSGQLTTRIVIFSNEVLRFQDESGALAQRFITWEMQQSFKGREDPNLTEKLLAERPGIFNLALDALDRLRKRDKFEQFTSGLGMSERLGALLSDIVSFVRDCCAIGADNQASVEDLFSAWKDWCLIRGIRHPWAEPQFSEKLRSAVPNLRDGRPRQPGTTKRPVVLFGIGLAAPAAQLTFRKWTAEELAAGALEGKS